MFLVNKRARGTPCSYCTVPVLHPNQQCCLNCKNHPFDILEPNDTPLLENTIGSPTPPISPTFPTDKATGSNSNDLVFEMRNIHDGTFIQISADDLKEEALWRHYSAGLVFERECSQEEKDLVESKHEGILSSITANHAIGLKIHGNAFGKTCLKEGRQFIENRSDENMAGSIIISQQHHSIPLWCRAEYSISEDSVCYSKVMIRSGAKAWYDEEINGHPAPWLFHEQAIFYITSRDDVEFEDEFDGQNGMLHGVVFNGDSEAQYRGPDNRCDNRVLVFHEGIEFSIKRQNLIVEVKVNENAYAQKLKADYSDLEEFWFQFGDKVWVLRDDEFDSGRIIVSYDEEKYSIVKEDIGL